MFLPWHFVYALRPKPGIQSFTPSHMQSLLLLANNYLRSISFTLLIKLRCFFFNSFVQQL